MPILIVKLTSEKIHKKSKIGIFCNGFPLRNNIVSEYTIDNPAPETVTRIFWDEGVGGINTMQFWKSCFNYRGMRLYVTENMLDYSCNEFNWNTKLIRIEN